MPVSLVSREAGALVAADVVGAVGEHVARPVLALVLVRHGAPLAAPAVVAVALRVQTGAVHATVAGRVQAVV